MRTRRHLTLDEAIPVLARTPKALDAMLRGLPEGWIMAHEGGETWSPFDVVGHLIHGEHTDWMPRVRRILADGDAQPFEPFDRLAQFTASAGKRLPDLLDELAWLRATNLHELTELGLTEADLDRKGRHPALGPVTLGQLLATWVAHDLDHIVQVARVMATQYSDEVGPWRAYLRVISGQQG
jgi:hypothetical protein